MSGDHGTITTYGFTWGPMEVTRCALLKVKKRENRVVQIKTPHHKTLDVYVSATGRSVRVFCDGKEWKP